jgi:hypothetical protein
LNFPACDRIFNALTELALGCRRHRYAVFKQ